MSESLKDLLLEPEAAPSGKRPYKRKLHKVSDLVDRVEADLLPLHNLMSIVRSVVPDYSESALVSSIPPPATGAVCDEKKRVKFTAGFQQLLSLCVSEFIHIVACKLFLSQQHKQTRTDEDVLQAMESLGISQYSTCLRVFMNDYRELVFNVLTRRLNSSLALSGPFDSPTDP
jgi:hypothetical protein